MKSDVFFALKWAVNVQLGVKWFTSPTLSALPHNILVDLQFSIFLLLLTR